MAKYEKYAEYKDSGVNYFGEIPSDWKVLNLRYVFDFLNEKRFPLSALERESKKGIYPYYGASGIIDYVDEYLLDEETILIAEDGANLLSRSTPLAFIAKGKYWVNNHAHILKPKNLLFNFWTYFLQSLDYTIYITGSAQPKLSREKLGEVIVLYPSLEEQTQIANFLDHETAKIDSLIEKQQQLIQLLKEKRQAVISHAVTKGLNSNVPMKDSGVEWLGQVPEHWDTTKIKYVAELTPKKSEVSSNDNRLCTFVPMEKLKLGSLIKDEEKPISEVIGGYTYFKNGDLLLAKVTPCFENKNMVVASDLKNGIGFGSSEIYVLRTNHKVNTQFLYYRLQEDQFMELGTGAMTGAGGLKRVPSEFLNNFEFALPPLSEQIAITKYLNQYLIKNEYLMNKAQSAIQLMQERRTALISAAVTGKIDVRNWQNPKNNNEAKTELSA